MTPPARAQAAIELLDAIIAASRDQGPAADTLIARYFSERRYAGSGDRRAVRALIYAAIRRAGERPVSGRSALLALAEDQPGLLDWFDGSAHGPVPLTAADQPASAGIAPAWLEEKLQQTLDAQDRAMLLERAPLDLRVNRLKAAREVVMALLPDARPTPHSDDGLRLPEGTAVEKSEAWLAGLVEIQDEGSQLATLATGAGPGMTVIDLCAGAGGKTLALAAMMENSGRLIACDTNRGRLSRLLPRTMRAGVTIAETRLLDPNREVPALEDMIGAADIVLVDAPCSGSGTWRRNPESRWRLTPERLDVVTALQARLLDIAASLVKPGGALTYVVCSVLAEEGEGQIERYLERNPEWQASPIALPAGTSAGAGLRLTPARDGTDGFFVARLTRPC